MSRYLCVIFLVAYIGCNSRDEVAKEKFVPPWEGPKSAARAVKDQVEGSAQQVDKQLDEMDEDGTDAESDSDSQ